MSGALLHDLQAALWALTYAALETGAATAQALAERRGFRGRLHDLPGAELAGCLPLGDDAATVRQQLGKLLLRAGVDPAVLDTPQYLDDTHPAVDLHGSSYLWGVRTMRVTIPIFDPSGERIVNLQGRRTDQVKAYKVLGLKGAPTRWVFNRHRVGDADQALIAEGIWDAL